MLRISTKNQVTIPVAALEEAGLRAGDQVVPRLAVDRDAESGNRLAGCSQTLVAGRGSHEDLGEVDDADQ